MYRWNRRYDAELVQQWLRSIVLGVLQEAEIAFTRLGGGSESMSLSHHERVRQR
jgi:hypothetical protein